MHGARHDPFPYRLLMVSGGKVHASERGRGSAERQHPHIWTVSVCTVLALLLKRALPIILWSFSGRVRPVPAWTGMALWSLKPCPARILTYASRPALKNTAIRRYWPDPIFSCGFARPTRAAGIHRW